MPGACSCVLQALAPVLARTVAETEQLLKEIAREKEEVVEPKRAMVDVEVKQADHAAAAARAIKEECEMILSEALPALEAATQVGAAVRAAVQGLPCSLLDQAKLLAMGGASMFWYVWMMW